MGPRQEINSNDISSAAKDDTSTKKEEHVDEKKGTDIERDQKAIQQALNILQGLPNQQIQPSFLPSQAQYLPSQVQLRQGQAAAGQSPNYMSQYNSYGVSNTGATYYPTSTYGGNMNAGINNYLNNRIPTPSYFPIEQQQVSFPGPLPVMPQQAQYQTSIQPQMQALPPGSQLPVQSQHPPSQIPQQPANDGYLNYMFKVTKPKAKLDEYSRKFNSKKMKELLARPYGCTFPGCDWAFARQSDLRRHAKSHAEPMFHCPYWRNDPTCHRNGGAFNRLDVLKRHLRLVHFVRDKQNTISGSKEDPGWCRACQRMFPNSKAFIDHCLDCAQQSTPAEWKSADSIRFQNMVGSQSQNETIEFQSNQQPIYDSPKGNSDEKENYFLASQDHPAEDTNNKRRSSESKDTPKKK